MIINQYVSGWDLAGRDKGRIHFRVGVGPWRQGKKDRDISGWDLAHRDKGGRIHFRVGLGPCSVCVCVCECHSVCVMFDDLQELMSAPGAAPYCVMLMTCRNWCQPLVLPPTV